MPRARKFTRFGSEGPDHHFLAPDPEVAAYQRGHKAWFDGGDRAASKLETTTELAIAWERGYDTAAEMFPGRK
jgi:hypothetical protein